MFARTRAGNFEDDHKSMPGNDHNDDGTATRGTVLERLYTRIRDWGKRQQIAAAVAVAGIVLFAPRLLAATTFYNTLGVGPDDVGIGFTDALGQAAVVSTVWVVGAFALVLVAMATFLAGVVGLFLLALSLWLVARPAALTPTLRRTKAPRIEEFVSSTDERLESSAERLRHPFRKKKHRARFLVAGLAAFAVVALQIAIIGWAWVEGKKAEDGMPTGPLRVFGTTLLDVRAERVTIAPTGGESQANAITRRSGCLFYLGQGHETTVLYDGTNRESIRIPSSSIVVTHTAERACPRSTGHGTTGHDTTGHGPTGRGTTGHGTTGHGTTGRGTTGHGPTGRGTTGHGTTGRGTTGHGTTGRGTTGHGATGQDTTGQGTTGQATSGTAAVPITR
jgi:hypothetical protein